MKCFLYQQATKAPSAKRISSTSGFWLLAAGCWLLALLTACAQPTSAVAPTVAAASKPQTLVLMTHDSFVVSPGVIQAFEQQHNAKVQILQAGDAGAALNKAILSKATPQADLFFGVDTTFLSRALAADLFEPSASPNLTSVPAQFKLDSTARLVPIDYGYVSLNYDQAYLTKNGLSVPQTLRDLTKPEWKSRLVVENPATSSPGLAFLLATVKEFGTGGSYTYLDFWRDLRANDVLVSESWEDAYTKQFSGGSGKGSRPLVVSYASSPPAEVIGSEKPVTTAPTGVIAAGSFLQIEFAGVLKGAKQRALAEQFIDYMLSTPFQEDMPLQMFVYPVQPAAKLPEAFTKYSTIPTQPLSFAPAEIEANRDQWIEAWTKVVLR